MPKWSFVQRKKEKVRKEGYLNSYKYICIWLPTGFNFSKKRKKKYIYTSDCELASFIHQTYMPATSFIITGGWNKIQHALVGAHFMSSEKFDM